MAKLIVTRPRLGPQWDIEPCFDLLIDGNPNASIGLGETVEVELPAGPHQVCARLPGAGSRSVLVDTAPGESRRLAVGPNVDFTRLLTWFLILDLSPMFGACIWLLIDSALLVQGIKAGTVSSHPGWQGAWQMAIMVPLFILFVLCSLAFPAISRHHALAVVDVAGPDLTVEQIAELLRERPFRVRITIRQLMIAVAISALLFWISVEVFRSTRASQFRLDASLHADLEGLFRGQNAAKADYHAAMRRKYAQASASRAFSVGPDPSAPP
jgi:hypothetical protein